MLDAVDVLDGDWLQRRVVEVDAHHGSRLLVEAFVADSIEVIGGPLLEKKEKA